MLRTRWWTTTLVLALLTGSACGGDSEDSDTGAETSETGDPDHGSHSEDSTGAGEESGSETAGPTQGGIPCEIDDILAANCRMCHTDPPQFGAPMPLVDHSHLLDPAVTDPTRPVWELVMERVVDPDLPMPPSDPMDESDIATLQAWIDAGAPADPDANCGGDPDPEGPVGPEALPCEPTQSFVASDGTGDGFHVPEVDDLYMCFTFRSPFAAGEQGTAWAPIIDDERVLHHWILFRTAQEQVDGGAGPCNMPSDATFLSGWAPGGQNFVLPDDVGLELAGPDEYLILQIHYNNVAGYGDAIDRSGVALCSTDSPRENLAGIFWLGSNLISIPPGSEDYEVSGTCGSFTTSFLPEPVNVLASFPHMHELGRSFTTVVNRGSNDGPADVMVDIDPFAFSNQKFYAFDPPMQIHPGDALTTTCRYDNPTDDVVRLGEGTADEMCYNFALVYPIDILGESRQCGLYN